MLLLRNHIICISDVIAPDVRYEPSTDDDTTANSSKLNNDLTDDLMDDIMNYTDDSPHVGIHSNLNETFLDQRPIIETETPQNSLLADSVATSSLCSQQRNHWSKRLTSKLFLLIIG